MSTYILTQVYILFLFPFKGTIFIMDIEWKNKNEEEEGERCWDLLNTIDYLWCTKKTPFNIQNQGSKALQILRVTEIREN